MRPHLAMGQQPVLRLKAKGLPLREIGPPLIVALPPSGRPATMGGRQDKGGRH